MRIGDFEITDHGNGFRMGYVGPKRYLTTASPDNNWWFDKLRASIGERKLWAKWIYEEPPLVNIEEDHDWWRGGICRPGDPKHIAQIIDEVNKAKKEKETAMDKNMKDYVGCKVLDVKFVPPHTTIFWDDGTVTRVKCVDEPYDSEKGFAMAVMKRLFGDAYFKYTKDYIEKYGGYEKDTHLIKIMDDCRGYFNTPIERELASKNEEIEKLKKENEELSELIKSETARADACRRDYLRMKDMYNKVVETNRKLHQDKINLINGYNRVKKDLDDHKKALEVLKERNAKLIKENENLEKMLKEFSDNREELRARIVRTEMLYNNQCAVVRSLNGRIDDLKKAKENMAKKLAETKQLKKDLDAQMLKNGELDRENQKLCRDAEIKSNLIDRQREDIHRLKEWFRREAEKVLNLQRRNATQAESIHTLLKENETLKISIEQINQIKEILK